MQLTDEWLVVTLEEVGILAGIKLTRASLTTFLVQSFQSSIVLPRYKNIFSLGLRGRIY